MYSKCGILGKFNSTNALFFLIFGNPFALKSVLKVVILKQIVQKMNRLIEVAIQEKRIIRFKYKGQYRFAEPHVLGKKGDKEQILVFQLSGRSNSGALPQWRRMNVNEITDLEITKHSFGEKRHLVTGNHRGWDEFYQVAQV